MTSPRTLNEIFFGAIDRYPATSVAMRAKIAGTWTDFDYRFVLDQVKCLAAGLRELGLNPGDRVALLSENRPEWAWADYACLALRCADCNHQSQLHGIRAPTSPTTAPSVS